MYNNIIDMDRTLMYSELWYLRDFNDKYAEQVKSFPAGTVSSIEQFLPWDVPKNSIAQLEVHDTHRNRWYELEGFQSISNATNQFFNLTPVVKNGKAGVAIQRNIIGTGSKPGITFTFRLRTMTPPFIQ